jgi:hypothetical protein
MCHIPSGLVLCCSKLKFFQSDSRPAITRRIWCHVISCLDIAPLCSFLFRSLSFRRHTVVQHAQPWQQLPALLTIQAVLVLCYGRQAAYCAVCCDVLDNHHRQIASGNANSCSAALLLLAALRLLHLCWLAGLQVAHSSTTGKPQLAVVRCCNCCSLGACSL